MCPKKVSFVEPVAARSPKVCRNQNRTGFFQIVSVISPALQLSTQEFLHFCPFESRKTACFGLEVVTTKGHAKQISRVSVCAKAGESPTIIKQAGVVP